MRWFNLQHNREWLIDAELAQLASHVAYRCFAMMPRETERRARQMRAATALGYFRARVGEMAARELGRSLDRATPRLVVSDQVRDDLMTRVFNELVLYQRKMPHAKLVTRRIARPKKAA
jgi:hypothetical protein